MDRREWGKMKRRDRNYFNGIQSVENLVVLAWPYASRLTVSRQHICTYRFCGGEIAFALEASFKTSKLPVLPLLIVKLARFLQLKKDDFN